MIDEDLAGIAELPPFVEQLPVLAEDLNPVVASIADEEAAFGIHRERVRLGEFPWTLSYDEIDVVLEGELVITRGAEVARGGPGDIIFIPRGSTITFGTPRYARFVYVAFPADWNARGETPRATRGTRCARPTSSG